MFSESVSAQTHYGKTDEMVFYPSNLKAKTVRLHIIIKEEEKREI